MPYCQIVYVSRAAPHFDRSGLADIQSKALGYNATHDITGALCYAYGWFMQVLEGPVAETNYLYTKIVGDSRHEKAILLGYSSDITPTFRAWTMKVINLEEKVSQESGLLVQYNEYKQFKPEEWSAERAVSFLHKLSCILPEV